MVTCRQSVKDLVGDECILRELAGIYAENFCNWNNTDTTGCYGRDYLDWYNVSNFKGSYGLSWGIACGGSTGASTRTT